jgi:hypothetical protein
MKSAWFTEKTAAKVQKRYSDTIEAAIGKARATREPATVDAPDGAEAYAYPHTRGVAWGINLGGASRFVRQTTLTRTNQEHGTQTAS